MFFEKMEKGRVEIGSKSNSKTLFVFCAVSSAFPLNAFKKSLWVSNDAEFSAEFNSAKNCKTAATKKVISQKLFNLLNKS